jgi:hypothetical protein
MKFQELLTDNATLTDAAVAFYSMQNGHDFSTSIMPNWLRFLENSVLYDKMVADDNVFSNQNWTQQLKADFGNVEGIRVDSIVRTKINEAANLQIHELEGKRFEDIHNNQIRSNVKRLMFYLGLANHLGSTYSPSSYRNSLLQGIYPTHQITGTKSQLESKLLNNVFAAASTYARNVENESGVKLIVAELPPISSLVIDQAIKCGSWTEAIFNIRQFQTAQSFRMWASEVTECLQRSDTNALLKLAKVNNFIKGWGNNETGGLTLKLKFKVGAILPFFKIPLDTEVAVYIDNPFPKKHIIFLNDTFHSLTSSAKNLGRMRNVRVC